MQHLAGAMILAAVDIHLDQHYCLEVIIMKGRGKDLQAIAQGMLALRSVALGQAGPDKLRSPAQKRRLSSLDVPDHNVPGSRGSNRRRPADCRIPHPVRPPWGANLAARILAISNLAISDMAISDLIDPALQKHCLGSHKTQA